MAVLYTKYRPKIFSEVVGQKSIVQTIKNSLKDDKLAHAYLFTGSRGVGKTTLARLLAKAANCNNRKDNEPCMSCVSCVSIQEGNSMDLLEIDAASNTGVDNIRELIDHVGFRPVNGKYKVYIIDEVHMLSKGAFNALLKTLEEPPEHALFILATTEIQKVPGTVISRTQRFDFKRIDNDDIQEQLKFILNKEKLKLDYSITSLISSTSGGGLRDALTRLEKVLSLGEDPSLEEASLLLGVTDEGLISKLLELVVSSNTKQIPVFFEENHSKLVDASTLTKDILHALRMATESSLRNIEPKGAIGKTLKSLKINDLLFLSRLYLRAYKEIPESPDSELPILLASVEAALHLESKKENPIVQAPPVTQTEKKPSNMPVMVKQKASLGEDVFDKVETPVQQKKNISGKKVSLEEVRGSWANVLEKVKSKNSPLSTLVKNSPLLSVEDNVVFVGVKYLFHKEHLESAKNLSILNSILNEEFNAELAFGAKIVVEEENLTEKVGAVDALQIFGGEIIE